MTGKPTGAAPNSLHNAVNVGLLRAVGEQRLDYRAEQLDTMTGYVVHEVRRYQAGNPRRRPPGVGWRQEQLLRLLSKGLDSRQIARRIGEPSEQVTEAIACLYSVLKVKDRLSAVVAAYELGILRPGEAVQR